MLGVSPCKVSQNCLEEKKSPFVFRRKKVPLRTVLLLLLPLSLLRCSARWRLLLSLFNQRSHRSSAGPGCAFHTLYFTCLSFPRAVLMPVLVSLLDRSPRCYKCTLWLSHSLKFPVHFWQGLLSVACPIQDCNLRMAEVSAFPVHRVFLHSTPKQFSFLQQQTCRFSGLALPGRTAVLKELGWGWKQSQAKTPQIPFVINQGQQSVSNKYFSVCCISLVDFSES